MLIPPLPYSVKTEPGAENGFASKRNLPTTKDTRADVTTCPVRFFVNVIAGRPETYYTTILC